MREREREERKREREREREKKKREREHNMASGSNCPIGLHLVIGWHDRAAALVGKESQSKRGFEVDCSKITPENAEFSRFLWPIFVCFLILLNSAGKMFFLPLCGQVQLCQTNGCVF